VADGDLVRAFPVSSLRASIDAALAQVPPGKPAAVIAYADMDGAKLAAFVRIGSDLSFVGTLDKRWGKPLKAEAVVAWYPGFGG
jgi:hypothetical protein